MNNKPYVMINGHIGNFKHSVIEGCRKAGEGNPCPTCGDIIEMGYGGEKCPGCYRVRLEDLGCKCGGSNLCPDCIKAGATKETRGKIVCEEGCDTLCPICSPDS